MDTTGSIHVIAETKVVSDKFKSRDLVLVISDNPQYPQYVSFQLTQDKCSLADTFQVGQEVNVSFNLRGRQWVNPQGEQRYFNTLECWKITPVAGAAQPPATRQMPTAQDVANVNVPDFAGLDDSGKDLPF